MAIPDSYRDRGARSFANFVIGRQLRNCKSPNLTQASLKDDTARNGNLAIHRNFKTT